ncbi:Proteasome subunit beta type-1 [Seminavis robusta]|uniref:Proteasome subunit beta type-1 n=1 Tax=Seminavis robusta TaxID=568900 RepID=A0A9N8EBH1_9STRA|nr:Proteasome subunit beta type-1 [Seminavis robusta]|eukprot:Sro903_g218210.1 Proteasome subunit beta type-1 (268) ;mRNA; r:8207-9010
MIPRISPLLILILLSTRVVGRDFEPYTVNGGLVSAVAAKDFVVIASDTRFVGESGYDIVSRDYVTSRLWMAQHDTDLLLGTTTTLSFAPTIIGSAGCAADCEALKRTIQAEFRTAHYFGTTSSNGVDPTLLSQVLYSRRTFPFYSFCVLAGLSPEGEGQVFCYDAIGSYEAVAVASAGTGRQLLQPILDRKFRTLQATTGSTHQKTTTVPTLVDCSAQEAVSILVDAYRSVSEREIQVGDNVVLCVVQKNADGEVQCQVLKVPLKKH